MPLPGIPQWLQALHRGASGDEQNPVFYISKSPRNLYDYLEHFLDLNECPKGPILLRDIGWFKKDLTTEDPGHKKEEIISILETFPDLPFIFLGDIAGKDPEIYQSMRKRYKDRVLAVYIRDINHRRKQRIYREWIKEHDIDDIQLIKSTLAGAYHSLKHGFIGEKTYLDIEQQLS